MPAPWEGPATATRPADMPSRPAGRGAGQPGLSGSGDVTVLLDNRSMMRMWPSGVQALAVER